MPHDVIFVHGMFMTPKSWAAWIARFSEYGYRCHAVAWPGHEGEPRALRAAPPEILRTTTLRDVMETHRAFISTLPRKPIVVGHSVGGLIAQRLLNEGLVEAAVALDSAPPKGILAAKWSFFRANLPVVNPFAGSRPFQFTLEQFHYAFCNTISLEETRPVFDALVVPESRKVARGPAGPEGVIDFAKAHAPLLIIGGERDHIVPWQLNEKNFRAYKDPGSVREFRVFPDRDHFLCGQRGWEELADYIHGWLQTSLPKGP
ncbi:MAG: alpha/beta fold hydrolase [Myxococcales bacterium]|nr:alpha/beta fold hydrolase [Myxococcales bacterium]